MKSFFHSSLFKIIPLTAIFFLPPVFALAAGDFSISSQGGTFRSFIFYIIDLLHIINPILSLLAFILFFWGLSRFVLSSGSPADIQKGRSYMLWGILALFILLSVNSILGILSGEFFGYSIGTPLLPTGSSSGTPPVESVNVNVNYNP